MRNRTRNLVLAAMLAALTAAGAFLRFPMGQMSGTLQFLFTALAGVVLGARWGAVSQAVYVALGLAGLPIFTLGGGLGYVLQPSFGFLLGLIPAAWEAGALSAGNARPGRIFAAGAAALAVLYLVGVPYMYAVLNLYLGRDMPLAAVLWSGMAVYLPGDFLKLLAVSVLAPPLRRALARSRRD